MERIDAVVIGAGVVGLAIARTLAARGIETLVLEAEEGIGTQTSSRNSEVIHAGIYYPPGSWKARLCVRGRHLLYAYLRERGLGHARCGKLIVAADPSQRDTLRGIERHARANGVDDLRWLEGPQALAMEPALRVDCALHSPSTGIVDSHALMLSLQGDAERDGAMFAFRSRMVGARWTAAGIEIDVMNADGTSAALCTRLCVNAAGHGAPAVAGMFDGGPALAVPQPALAKGNYFGLLGRTPFSRLIYPVPEPGGLGVHLTLDLAGRARFGPDVEWIDVPDYSVSSERIPKFESAIRRWWPGLPPDSLAPDYAGLRPKIRVAGEIHTDFMVEPLEDGLGTRALHLFGIESPGLTACLAFGAWVDGWLDEATGRV